MAKRPQERIHAALTAVVVLAVLVVAALVVTITGRTDGFATLGALVVAVVGVLAVRPRSGE